MKIEAQITSIISNPMQYSSQNAVLSYQYPCYGAICISNILDIPQVYTNRIYMVNDGEVVYFCEIY